MNNLLVVNDKIIAYHSQALTIKNNTITFHQSGTYQIEYQNCHHINLTYNFDKDVYVKLFEYSTNDKLIIKNEYNLYQNANITLYKFYNNQSTDENININLKEEKAHINYHFSSISIGKDQHHIKVNHLHKNTFSDIYNKSITINKGQIEFIIDSILPKGNQGCILNQDTRIITLNDNKSIIHPNMYIDENDVEARHGSIIGRFSHDEIFYLMTRGINYNNAIKLLVKGYLFSNLILDMEGRAKIFEIINKYWR